MSPSRAFCPRRGRVLALLALALLVRALTPSGWMPVFENGTIALRLCNGVGPVAAKAPAAHSGRHVSADHHGAGHHGEANGKEHSEPRQPCPFAIASLPGAIPQPILAPEPIAVTAGALLLPLATAVGMGLAAPPPPARGPPPLS
jgi:hypothetical protein